MQNRKVTYRSAFILLIVVSVMVCPLATGIYSQRSRAYAGQPFNTVPPINATFTAPVGTAVVEPTPIPTLGPGQYFEENDTDVPKVTFIEEGDEEYGYGPIKGEKGLYLLWVTEGGGKHYLVVSDKSDMLLGMLDEDTDERSENGFIHYIKLLDEARKDVEEQQIVANSHQRKRMGSHTTALGIALVGGLICGILTAGACLVAFGGAALVAWGNGVNENAEKLSAQDRLDQLQSYYDDAEQQVLGKFEQAVFEETHP